MPQKSRYADVHVPTDLLLPDFIIENTRKYGSRTAMLDVVSGRQYTFTQLSENIKYFARGLKSAGFKRDDVLCMFTPNCIEYPLVYYGVMYLGAVIFTANPSLTQREIIKQVKDCKATYICCTEDALETVRTVEEKVGKFKKILLVGLSNGNNETVEELVATGKEKDPLNPDESCQRLQTDPTMIIYSSGTSGFPKGIKHNHIPLAYCYNQLTYKELDHFVDGKDVTLSFLPFYHLWAQCTSMWVCLLRGTTNIVFPRFHEETFIKAIEQYKATILYLVPPIVVKMVRNPLSSTTDLSSVKHAISAAAPLRKEQTDALKTLLKDADVKQGFGMSEICLATYGENNCKKPESSGVLLPNVQAKIMGIGDRKGQELGPNEQGEVWFKSPCDMMEYLNMPEETRLAHSEDGWLKSGDIAYFDDDGYYYIVDRLKEIINYKGFNVCPAELEGLLLACPSVADAAVIGVKDEEAVELVRAYVVVKPGQSVTEVEIQTYMEGLIAPYKKLRGGVIFVDEIPKSPSGKILRRLLRDQASSDRINT